MFVQVSHSGTILSSIPDLIVAWADGRPAWQRDALRRLFASNVLSTQDMAELLNICRREAGLTVPDSVPVAVPIAITHVSAQSSGSTTVALAGIANVDSINALAPQLTLAFAQNGLTVVYGDNGAGKSGYARILKHACRARGDSGKILPDIFEDGQGQPKADIAYTDSGVAQLFEWKQTGARPDALREISVFDSTSATVYVDEKTDVAFRPFGLDVFPKLVQACDSIRASLQGELGGLGTERSFPELFGEHEVGSTVTRMDAADAEGALRSLADLNEEDETRLLVLKKQVAALDVDAPARRAAEGKLRLARFRTLQTRINAITVALGSDSKAALSAKVTRLQSATEAATLARAEAAGYEPAWQIGSAAWQHLWSSAKKYSELVLERQIPFFDAGIDAVCALCKTPTSAAAQDRLKSFSAFASHEALTSEAAAAADLENAITSLRVLLIATPDDETLFAEVGSIHADTATHIRGFMRGASAQRDELVEALSTASSIPSSTLSSEAAEALAALVTQETGEIAALAAASEADAARAVRNEYALLSARRMLKSLLPEVLSERARRVQRKALAKAMKQVETAGITTKNTELTKAGISDQLRRRFQTELNRLNLQHLTVSVEPQHGAKGVTFHQVRFATAKSQGWTASEVLSEGEQRCIALAGFLAEVSTQPSGSGIVFDDPVSSLDHERRSLVATRIVEEAKDRQVIVFTHDLVFLLFLEEECDRQGINWKSSYLAHKGAKRGVPYDGLPWYGQTLKKRIGWLRQQVQQLSADAKSLDKDRVEMQAALLWGRLREAWECGVEETLLGGAVRRFSRKVQTQQLRHVSDISTSDIDAVNAGMTLASTWMPGHDLAGAINQPIPSLDVLKGEIEKLDAWRLGIEARRKKAS